MYARPHLASSRLASSRLVSSRLVPSPLPCLSISDAAAAPLLVILDTRLALFLCLSISFPYSLHPFEKKTRGIGEDFDREFRERRISVSGERRGASTSIGQGHSPRFSRSGRQITLFPGRTPVKKEREENGGERGGKIQHPSHPSAPL